jgi:hypothetical protein
LELEKIVNVNSCEAESFEEAVTFAEVQGCIGELKKFFESLNVMMTD